MANLVGKISSEKEYWDTESKKYCFIKYTVYYYIVCKCKYYGRSRVLNTLLFVLIAYICFIFCTFVFVLMVLLFYIFL